MCGRQAGNTNQLEGVGEGEGQVKVGISTERKIQLEVSYHDLK